MKIDKIRPDVLAVQGCNQLIYEILGREMKIMGYKFHLPEIIRKKTWGELIFSQYPISKYNFTPFPTQGDVGITSTVIDVFGVEILVATTKIFSLSPEQNTELNFCVKYIEKSPYPVIFGGDLNIKNFSSFEIRSEKIEDPWYDLGTEENKYTVDCHKNQLVDVPIQDRCDRVWYTHKNLKCENFELIDESLDIPNSHWEFGAKSFHDLDIPKAKFPASGKFQVDSHSESDNITISSHFGVLCRFNLS
jgi:hypothetical protein